MTYLQLVNYTIRRLRGQEVASVASSSYSAMIGDLVNACKREVEDAWNWLDLMTTTTVSVVNGTDTYTLTGYGNRYLIRQVHDTTNKGYVRAVTHERFRRLADFSSVSSSVPSYWHIDSFDSNGDPKIRFWPSPTASVTVKVYAKVAQAELSDDTDVLTVPFYPVQLGAYAKAVSERGEDGGVVFDEAMSDYRQALADAIAQDDQNRAMGHESDWRVA